MSLFSKTRHLFVSQWKKTLATRIIFLVTALTSLTFVSWSILKQPTRKCALWAEVNRFYLLMFSLLIYTQKAYDYSNLADLLLLHVRNFRNTRNSNTRNAKSLHVIPWPPCSLYTDSIAGAENSNFWTHVDHVIMDSRWQHETKESFKQKVSKNSAIFPSKLDPIKPKESLNTTQLAASVWKRWLSISLYLQIWLCSQNSWKN